MKRTARTISLRVKSGWYTKPYLTKAEFISQSGLSERYVERCVRSDYADRFVIRDGDCQNSKIWIDVDRFTECQKKGYFREY